ncbi:MULTISPECIES: hypothetical protein [unclassified Serratia (in: enterobacteria)]|uniref:hypothetical protein n=1 Tax=unclassified Serratia (in: enterobacteria) TaxID=2647522 RepID=UPI0004688D76|nr:MULTISPECIES: hypothetical protein [unclassified Serratia (in: enterobacteria)]
MITDVQQEIIDSLNTMISANNDLQIRVAKLEAIVGIDDMVIMSLFANVSAEERLNKWDEIVADMLSTHVLDSLKQDEESKEKYRFIVDAQKARVKFWTEVFRGAAGKD